MGIRRAERVNGDRPAAGPYDEIGSAGIEAYAGYITEAYNAKLHWPSVEPIYSRIWRSDPEVAIVRTIFSSLSRDLSVDVQLPEQMGGRELGDPTDDDKRLQEFIWSVIEDIDGGIQKWVQSSIIRVPFFGWGLWEQVLGVRSQSWSPPGRDDWRSEYDDGLVGLRRLPFRDYSSFWQWDMDDYTGRVYGMYQFDPPNSQVLIPFDRALHVTYGNPDSVEGLATLEAIWRLERLLYGKEVIQGIGFEHTAGHLSVTVDEELDAAGMKLVEQAAKAIMSAQPGNYAVWPGGVSGEIIDSTFSAATALETSIQNTRILKLAIFMMQFVAISTMTGSGSFAALADSSNLALVIFNAITGGIIEQFNRQVVKRLVKNPTNAAAFPNITRTPELVVSPAGKQVDLASLGAFMQSVANLLPLGDDDYLAIRRHSDFLPEKLPEDGVLVEPAGTSNEPEETEGEGEKVESEIERSEPDDEEVSELARRPITLPDDEQPINLLTENAVTDEDIKRAVRKFRRWARENAPDISNILEAEEV